MKQLKAILIALFIWGFGVSIYVMSFYVPLLTDAEKQANLLLSISVIPLVWFGAKQYYKKEEMTHGFWLGQAFFLTSALLDALITVPVFIIPNGGSYLQFYSDPGFWFIGFEFLAVVTLYYYRETKRRKVDFNKINLSD